MTTLGITAHYRAPLGVLQENIRATALHAREAGWHVVLALPEGPFRSSLQAAGFDTHVVDFADAASVDAAANFLARADVLHFHPGARRAALAAAAISGAPLVYTVHGKWHDAIAQYASRLAAIVCVSESVARQVAREVGEGIPVDIVPNGVDLHHFDGVRTPEAGRVLAASRFDADKLLLVELLIALWDAQARAGDFGVHWEIAGNGTQLHLLEAAAARLEAEAGQPMVRFCGWLDAPSLAQAMRRASAVVAPGRSALEALAMGVPPLAVGSGGVTPAFEAGALALAARSNFGGYGAASPATLDLDALWASFRDAAMSAEPSFGDAARAFIAGRFDNPRVNAAILSIYERALAHCRVR